MSISNELPDAAAVYNASGSAASCGAARESVGSHTAVARSRLSMICTQLSAFARIEGRWHGGSARVHCLHACTWFWERNLDAYKDAGTA